MDDGHRRWRGLGGDTSTSVAIGGARWGATFSSSWPEGLKARRVVDEILREVLSAQHRPRFVSLRNPCDFLRKASRLVSSGQRWHVVSFPLTARVTLIRNAAENR